MVRSHSTDVGRQRIPLSCHACLHNLHTLPTYCGSRQLGLASAICSGPFSPGFQTVLGGLVLLCSAGATRTAVPRANLKASTTTTRLPDYRAQCSHLSQNCGTNELRLHVDLHMRHMQSTLQATGTDTLQFAPQPWLPRGNWSAGKGSCKRLVCSSACKAPRPPFSLWMMAMRAVPRRRSLGPLPGHYSTELRALTKPKNPLVTSSIASEGGRRGGSGHTVPRSTSQHRIPALNSSLDCDPRLIRCLEVCNPITHELSPAGGELQQRSTLPICTGAGGPVSGTHNQLRGRCSLQD